MVKLYPDPLVGFVEERVHTRGFVDLLMTFSSVRTHQTLTVKYLLVGVNTSYNVLIGWRTLNTLGAIVSTLHMTMKFPSEQGDIIIVMADPKMAQECYVQSLRINLYTVRRTSSSVATPSQVEVLESCIKEECNNVDAPSSK